MSLTEKTDIRDSDEKVVEIEMERLRTFTNHPFKVIGDSQMIELQDSIKKYRVLNSLIVRPRKEGYYEIISGHRRKYAAERLGYKKIPVIIRMMQDDEAVVTMVDSNLQREQITPSEKAYAYKIKYDTLTYTREWHVAVYITVAFVIFIASMILQHAFLAGRIIFTIFVSIAVAIIGAGWKAYDTEIQRNTVMVICFTVTVILGLISWKGIKAQESE